MDVELIGVPIFFGSDRQGVEFGPEKLRENDIVSIIKNNNHQVLDMGNLHVRKVTDKEKYYFHSRAKYLDPIIEADLSLAEKVYTSHRKNRFPFVIGGDHSLGLGSISGTSKYYDEIAVVWMDAHGDINTFETSPTGNVHGMPLAAAMGIGDPTLVNLYYNKIKVKPENVFVVGARDLDHGEVELINKLNLNLWTTTDIKKMGIAEFTKKITGFLKIKNLDIHLSFDIDCLDSSIVPGTGTPVSDGFSKDDVKFILKNILETGLVKSMDFVELNTLLDEENRTLNTALELIDHTFKYLS